nr:MAG TPA: Thioredoxin-like domain [Caudoviricetes sp.]
MDIRRSINCLNWWHSQCSHCVYVQSSKKER